MRVLLIATNRHDKLQSRLNAQPMPIGLAYIAGHLDHERHEVKVLDLMFSNDHLADLEATVKEFQPQMVGMSVRNLSNHSYMNTIWALPVSKEGIDRIRTVSDAVIVCGGPAFSIMPSECFEYLGADLGLSGDAGETFAALADRMADGEPSYFDLPGLVYKKDGQTFQNEGFSSSEFAKPPRLEDLDMHRYNKAGFGIGILTKLGGFYYPASASEAQINESGWREIRPIDEDVAAVKTLLATPTSNPNVQDPDLGITVLSWAAFHGTAEIAATLGISEGAAEQLLVRARGTLRRMLEREEEEARVAASEAKERRIAEVKAMREAALAAKKRRIAEEKERARRETEERAQRARGSWAAAAADGAQLALKWGQSTPHAEPRPRAAGHGATLPAARVMVASVWTVERSSKFAPSERSWKTTGR